VKKNKTGAAELKDLIQHFLHHPDFNPDNVDHDMHELLMNCIAAGDIEVIDLLEDSDGNQAVMLYKRPILKVQCHSASTLRLCCTRTRKVNTSLHVTPTDLLHSKWCKNILVLERFPSPLCCTLTGPSSSRAFLSNQYIVSYIA
jgi:hypothetical protein